MRLPARFASSKVELVGEMDDFRVGRPAVFERIEGDEAVFCVDLPPLAPGVYAYKLRVDGVYMLDAGNPRTRRADGYRNNLLSVGGAPEPLLFAPASPFVFEDDDGALVITAALRRGHGDALSLRWLEQGAEPARSLAMTLVGEEDEHLFFRARLPVSTGRVQLGFAHEGEYLVELPRDELPAWWRRALVYTIFVDRFRPKHASATWSIDPGPNQPAGGHLDGITRSLDELVHLGVSVLYLTPIHVAANCHRYDLVDPGRIDPALGGEAAFVRLLEAAHARELRVLVDFSFSHAGRGFPPYEDVIARGRASRFARFFQWAGDELVHYGSRNDAPLFDLAHPELRALVLETAEAWARRGVDGLRLDAAAEVPIELAREIRRRFRAVRPDGLVLGELVPAHAFRWIAEEAVDAATDFVFHAVTVDFIAKAAIDTALAAERIRARQIGFGAPLSAAMRFLSTHDHPRFATLAHKAGDCRRAELGLVFLFSAPGVPALLYGEELGLVADTLVLEPENVWPDRMPMPELRSAEAPRTRALVRELALLRQRSPALLGGSFEIVFAEERVMVIRRACASELVDVVLNVGEPVEIDLEDDEFPVLIPLVVVGEVRVLDAKLVLGRSSALIARRTRGEAQKARQRLEVLGNARVRDEDLSLSALEARARPSRMDFSITELCNLRCAHCITRAPERSRERTARTLRPWLLDRLREDLRFVEYAGFVHGGESLLAPIFFDVLSAIRAARGALPTTIHLLTNGVLLSEPTLARLIDAGVCSISVSLDGATKETNDAIRLGGRFERVIENLTQVARLRREWSADLRLGVSFVITAENVGEVEAMVELCARMGVDWIKFEELVPVGAYAARSLMHLSRQSTQDAVSRALKRAGELGLVAVDHTLRDRMVWRCRLEEDPESAAFLRADEFANRSEIHPCRGPWEIACVEPNGDIRLGDFFGPVLGNVGETPLVSLWNGPLARGARINARATRLCGAGPASCVSKRDT